MRILKIPAKIIIAPVIAAIWLVCLIGKVATHLSCYIFGPVILIIGIILIIMAFKKHLQGFSAIQLPRGIVPRKTVSIFSQKRKRENASFL